jgi:hypothetical protein
MSSLLVIQSVMLVFRTNFVKYCPSNLLSGSSPLPLPPSLCKSSVYTYRQTGRVLSPVGDHILQEFNTPYLSESEPTKLLDHPKQKPRRGGDLSHINTYNKVPMQVNFFR